MELRGITIIYARKRAKISRNEEQCKNNPWLRKEHTEYDTIVIKMNKG